MFTGIVEEVGIIKEIGNNSTKLIISSKKVLENTKLGDSIAVNGVCLTVTQLEKDFFCADCTHETLNKSSLGDLKKGSRVNLERAMQLGGRFGGHIVLGHVDGTGKIISRVKDGESIILTIGAEKKLLKYIVEKGSVTIDGISLTVASISADRFSIALIPHTMRENTTTINNKVNGERVNIECDILGKYIEKLCGKSDNITMDFLASNGFC